MSDGGFSAEVVRIYRRYQIEIVEALKLCPWAERARLDGRVVERVIATPDLAPRDTLEAIAALSRDERIEIGLLIYPRATASYAELEQFVARVVKAEARRHGPGAAPFAMAAFHPGASVDTATPERLIPFLRRSPDPTIQLVRYSSLERVREGFPEGTQFLDVSKLMTMDLDRADLLPLRERIARANFKTVQRLGLDEIQSRLAAIRADRDAAYARFPGERGPDAPRAHEP
jgi:hypothetical protein